MNPRLIPLTLESLTSIERAYAWVAHKKKDIGYKREWLIYRMASKLIEFELERALPKQDIGKWQKEVTK